MASKPWFVYMIEAEGGSLYTGISTDVERRFAEHLAGGAKAARFFRTRPARKLVYREQCADRSEALRREIEIKKLSRKAKLALLANSQ